MPKYRVSMTCRVRGEQTITRDFDVGNRAGPIDAAIAGHTKLTQDVGTPQIIKMVIEEKS